MHTLFLRQPPSAEALLGLVEIDGAYQFSQGGSVFTLDPASLFTPFETVVIYQGEAGFFALPGEGLIESRDGAASIFLWRPAGPVAVIYFDATPTEYVLVVNAAVDTALPHAPAANGNPLRSAATVYPMAATLEARRNLKTDLLQKINPISVLVALEQQLDLLSTLVIAHFDGLPAEQRPAWYDEFKAAVEAFGTANIRPVADNVASLAAYKANIRQHQAAYLATRAAIQ